MPGVSRAYPRCSHWHEALKAMIRWTSSCVAVHRGVPTPDRIRQPTVRTAAWGRCQPGRLIAVGAEKICCDEEPAWRTSSSRLPKSLVGHPFETFRTERTNLVGISQIKITLEGSRSAYRVANAVIPEKRIDRNFWKRAVFSWLYTDLESQRMLISISPAFREKQICEQPGESPVP